MSRFGWTIDGHPIGETSASSGFARPFVHVLFDQPPDWRLSAVRASFLNWFYLDPTDLRAVAADRTGAALQMTIDGHAIDCRLSCLPAPPSRFSHEIDNSPWFPEASAIIARHRRRAVLSPAISPAEWAAAPHAVRIDSMRALTKVAAAFALLRHASATVWPVSQTVWAPRTAALAAHDPYPSMYWVRSRLCAPERRVFEVSATSSGLSAFVGCEIAVRAAEPGSERRVSAVLGDVIDHLVRRGPDGAEPLRFARGGAATAFGRGVRVEAVRATGV